MAVYFQSKLLNFSFNRFGFMLRCVVVLQFSFEQFWKFRFKFSHFAKEILLKLLRIATGQQLLTCI